MEETSKQSTGSIFIDGTEYASELLNTYLKERSGLLLKYKGKYAKVSKKGIEIHDELPTLSLII